MTLQEKEAAIRRLPMPEGMTRMESGPVAFGEDWPGYFLRGDDAFALLNTLGVIKVALKDTDHWDLLTRQMDNAMDRLRQCILCDDIKEPKP